MCVCVRACMCALVCARRWQVRESDKESVRECKGVREKEKRWGTKTGRGMQQAWKSRADVPLNNYRTLVLCPLWYTVPDGQSINTLMGLNCRFYPSIAGALPNAECTVYRIFIFPPSSPSWHFAYVLPVLFNFTLFLLPPFLSPPLFFFHVQLQVSASFSWIYRRRKTMYLECTLWNRFPFIRRFGNSLQMRHLR